MPRSHLLLCALAFIQHLENGYSFLFLFASLFSLAYRLGRLQVDDELLTDYFKSLLHKPTGSSKVPILSRLLSWIASRVQPDHDVHLTMLLSCLAPLTLHSSAEQTSEGQGHARAQLTIDTAERLSTTAQSRESGASLPWGPVPAIL